MWSLNYKGYHLSGWCNSNVTQVQSDKCLEDGRIHYLKSMHAAKLFATKELKCKS